MKHKIFCIGCIIMTLLFATAMSVFAQDVRDERMESPRPVRPPMPEEKGFKKENLFTGGNVSAGFSSGYTLLGASPMLGYKLNDYVDAGVVLNYLYTGTRDNFEYNDKLRQHTYGPGAFVRAYPIPMLFAQAQVEQNFITQKYIGSTGSGSVTASAPSLLLGGGYAGGRQKGGNSFYYIAILADVLKNPNSPYVNVDYNNGVRRVLITPVIRAGFNVGLFQKRYNHYYNDRY